MSTRDAEQWQRYLAEYSADVLRTAEDDDLTEVSDRQRDTLWLGFDGAPADRLDALEQRLGVALPPSYRAFLAVSDGWLNLSAFMWTMATTETAGWLRDVDAEMAELLEEDEVEGLGERALLVSGDGDAQYWLLDPGDVSADGEWAAYVWASWYPGLGERHDSFAALVDDQRASFESLSGRDGRAVHPDGADELVDEGRARALRGEVDGAIEVFRAAQEKGSGAGAYLAAMLEAFTEPATAHHTIRNDVLSRRHVLDEIGLEQIRAEAVPLFLKGSAPGPYRNLFAGVLTAAEVEDLSAFTPPVLPEVARFQTAIDLARTLVRNGDPDQAWTVLHAALPSWRPLSPNRIAPTVLLTDPDLRRLINPERAACVVRRTAQ
ncbi:SMI1/KNR4 family protein [Actinoplanes sp. G11-F43]|uniref:SMI1/KNR4 family protein n=1 Tax=Actinoplanes sp. G11-F43 TaxID=3424130 RepID=UPI003D356952